VTTPTVNEPLDAEPTSGISLRVKLVAAVLVLVAIALSTIGAASVLAFRTYLVDRVDAELPLLAERVYDDVDLNDACGIKSATGIPPDYLLSILDSRCPKAFFDGNSHEPEDIPTLPTDPASIQLMVDRAPFTHTSSDGQRRWRLIVQRTKTGQPFAVGEDLSRVDKTLKRLILINVFVGTGVLVALAAAGVWLVRASLKPLVEIERTAAAIAGGDLTRRVPGSDPRTEVGRLAGTLNTMLTQIEAAFRAREASERQALRSEERMRQFVADASHELRTPLTTIRGFAELYRQGAAGNDPAPVLRRIEDEAKRMGLLVEDLLLLARLDRERPLAPAPVRMKALIMDAAAAAHAIDPDRTIEVDLPPRPEELIVDGDEGRLRQVVGNLVTNALAHTPGGTPIELRLRADDAGERAVVEVSDAGPGLTDEQAERVFERFYRVDKARTRRAAVNSAQESPHPHSGTGLGLAIVAALVAAHDGSVEVETSPGAGATFRVLLPLATDAPAEVDDVDDNGSQETSSPDPGPAKTDRATS
jgi:two-component system OmpR family sensor kinase